MAEVREPRRRRPGVIASVLTAVALAAVAVALLVRFDVFGSSSGSNGALRTGPAAAQARALPSFRSVELAGSNDVTISVGKRQSVVVHGDRGVLHRVTTHVQAGNLVIGETPGRLTSTSPMRVDITMPFLSALRLTGSGVMIADHFMGAPLKVTLSGSGVIRAAGYATNLGVTLSGSGDAQLDHLPARDVNAVLNGSGRILVNAISSLHASVSGSGAIVYVGHPDHLTTSVTGSGAVVPAGDEAGIS